MISNGFTALLGIRLTLVLCLMFATTWLYIQPEYFVATFLSTAILILCISELWVFIRRMNRDLIRFLNSAKYADFSQRFRGEDDGSGFGELGKSFNAILDRMREKRASSEIENQRLKALIEHIPIPLLTIHSDQSISLQNNAVRRLFGTTKVTQLDDIKQFGEQFYRALSDSIAGKRELVEFVTDGIDCQLAIDITENLVVDEKTRLVSLQNIQSELDINQAQAWQDLVRVLTHEIMNSITPISSLASTALDISKDIKTKAPSSIDTVISNELDDLQDAVTTVARRSDDLLQFVDSYRELQRIAPPEKKSIKITSMFESISSLAAAEWSNSNNWLSFTIVPQSLEVYADQVLLEPVLLNLLKNAYQATSDTKTPKVEVQASLNRRGHVVIEVSDNGYGVSDDIAKKIFVPFFTTKQNGSGVGLALARQVMTAHNGFIRVSNNDVGGAVFRLTF